MKYDIIVLGSGPGGYVTAIRASQLGFKVAVIEKENLGGVCLNWGCIPTKAFLKSAQVFEYLKHSSDYGITTSDAKVDFDAVIKRSRGVANGMSKGIEFLMKKNKITVYNGHGSFVNKNMTLTPEQFKKQYGETGITQLNVKQNENKIESKKKMKKKWKKMIDTDDKNKLE